MAERKTDRGGIGRRRWFVLVTLLLSGAFGVVIVEAVSGLVFVKQLGTGNRSLQLLGWRAEPNSRMEGVQLNSEGFTGAVLPVVRQDPDDIRVLCLGGSVMFYLSMAKEIGKALQPLTERKVSVVSVGLPLHTSRSSCIKYDRYFHQHGFDFVLIYHAINDLFANHHSPEDFRSDYSHLNAWYHRDWLVDNSIAARVIYNRVLWEKPTMPNQGIKLNQSEFAGSVSFAANMEHLVTAARRDGAVPILMTFATHIADGFSLNAMLDGKLGYVATKEHFVNGLRSWGQPEYVIEGLQRHNDIIQKISDEREVLLVDQQQALSADIKNFVDPCHFSPEGQRRFITNLVQLFAEQGLFRRPVDDKR